MIISYSRNFIFIRTRKTASTTVEMLLRSCLGRGDIYVADRTLVTSGGTTPSPDGPSALSTHMKAPEIKDLVSEEFWNASYKFTSERHPYEKAISLAYFVFSQRQKKGRFTSCFEEFLDGIVAGRGYRGYDHYSVDGSVVVDDFIRHEQFQSDIERIMRRLGLEAPDKLPRRRSGSRHDARPAREILSATQKQVVFETCREEFDTLGYDP